MNTGEFEIKENEDGELFFRIPDDMLDRLGWKEGDEVEFVEKDRGFIIKKVKYESIDLDIPEEDLLKYMMFAHEQGITFNELCERAVREKINEADIK